MIEATSLWEQAALLEEMGEGAPEPPVRGGKLTDTDVVV